MPNVPLLQTEAQKWQHRIALITQAGMPAGPVTELARSDLQRISRGGSSLPDDEISSLVHSAYTGQVSTPVPVQQSKPADFNPLNIIGNVGKDLATDVRAWPAGMIHLGADILNPHKWQQTGSDLAAFKFGSISDMAKEIQAMPILGAVTPWTFALTAGTQGITQHPLNFLLSVASVAAPAGKLATASMDIPEGSALSSLQEGHPFKAALQQLGAYDPIKGKITEELNKTQFGSSAMATWKAISAYSRAGTKAFYGRDLKDLGKLLNDPELTIDGGTALINEAQTFNTRYEQDAIPVPPPVAEHAKLDVASLTHAITPNRDIVAYMIGDVGDGLTAPHQIFLSATDAANTMPEVLRGQLSPTPVRVRPGDITGEGGTLTGKDILPLRSYANDPKRLDTLNKVRAFVDDHSTLKRKLEDGKGPASVVSLDGEEIGIYPNKSAPVKRMGEYHAASASANTIRDTVRDLAGQLSELEHATTGATLADIYASSQEALLAGAHDESLGHLYQQLNSAFQSENIRGIQSALSSLSRALTRQGKDSTSIEELKHQLVGINERTAKIGSAKRRATVLHTQLETAQSRLSMAESVVESTKSRFIKAMQKRQPDKFNPMVESQVRTGLKNVALAKTTDAVENYRVNLQAGAASTAIQQALDAYMEATSALADPTRTPTREEMMGLKDQSGSPFFDKKTFMKVQREAVRSWTDMVKAGYDPIWIHQIDPEWSREKIYGTVRPLTSTFKPTQDRSRIFDYRPKVLDISAQLSHQAMEYRTELATTQFLDFMVNKSGAVHKYDTVVADLEKRFPGHGEAVSHLKSEYRDWHNPNDPKTHYIVPRPVANGLDKLMSGGKLGGPLGRAERAGHRVFKVAVLSGPRHMVHVGVGGLVQLALREPGALTELAHPRVLFDIVHGKGLPSELSDLEDKLKEIRDSGQVYKGQYEEIPDQLHAYRGGTKLGQWFRQSLVARGLHNAETYINVLENNVTDMYRASIMLDQLKHGAENEAAITLVNKVLLDVDNLTPFEQNIVRQIFPFWSFTKHALRYVLTYPADHPVRAAILSQLAQHIEDTNQSGDPGRLSKLFFLGSPDALGNVNTVDYSNINPFRSMSSVFSMTGFLSGLAPEFQVALKAFGINTLTGAPSLFQNYTYDQYSGTNIASRPKPNLFDFASAYIPQAQILDHYLLLTDTMRQLKANNPEAYQRTLMQEMNLPFTIAPININDVRAKAAAMQYRDAQNAVTDAMRTGDTSVLRQYVAVPFQGWLFPASEVANYVDYYQKLYGGKIAPKAVAVRPHVPKRPKGSVF